MSSIGDQRSNATVDSVSSTVQCHACSEGLRQEHVRPEALIFEGIVHAAALPEVLGYVECEVLRVADDAAAVQKPAQESPCLEPSCQGSDVSEL